MAVDTSNNILKKSLAWFCSLK